MAIPVINFNQKAHKTKKALQPYTTKQLPILKMTISWSGTATLLVLVLAGPAAYGFLWLYKRHFSRGAEDQITTTSAKEERKTLESSEYLISLIGYAIGIGNIWRFPYVIANNGGAAALFAYLLCLVLVAGPLFLYELILGQHVRLSTVRCYAAIHSRWTSLGYASGIMLFFALCYYAMVNAYTLPYIYNSCKDPLPWLEDGANAESFWNEHILNAFPDVHDKEAGLGGIQWNLATSLFGFWVVVLLSTCFGKKVLAKITYVTVILPVVLMLILVGRTVFLDGAGDGIKFYIGKFEASKLADITVWATACSQILFSLSPGFGTAITYSSYSRPKEDVYRTCIIVVVCNSLFSIIGGFAIFSIVGNVAYMEGVPVEEVATRSGAGLAFVTIAEGMQHFGNFSNVMSVLFYSMLFLLGLDSAYAWLETLVSYVEDIIHAHGWKAQPSWKVTTVTATTCFLCGLPFTTRLGLELVDVVDHFVATLFLLFVVFLEVIMLNVNFGWKRMAYALHAATVGNASTPNGRSLFPKWLCRLDFHITVPGISGALGLYLLQADIRSPYGDYPAGLLALGWTLFGLLIVISFITIGRRSGGSLPDIMPMNETNNEKEAGSGDLESNIIVISIDETNNEKEAGSGDLENNIIVIPIDETNNEKEAGSEDLENNIIVIPIDETNNEKEAGSEDLENNIIAESRERS